MISYIRLSRSELARRKRRKLKFRILGSIIIAAVVITIGVGAALSIPSRPQAEPATQANETDQPERILIIGDPGITPLLPELETDLGVPDTADSFIDWVPYYVVSDALIPIHAAAGESSEIAGSLNPGAVVCGYPYDVEWICVAGATDAIYYVKADYVIPFGRELSELSIFENVQEVASGGFSVNTNINSLSGMTLADIAFLLEDYPALQEIRESVLLFEKKYGVNAYFILGVASQESGYGTSPLAARKNNLFGIGAFDDDSFESALAFASKSESVDYFCMLIAGYRENKKTTPAAINERYASDPLWAGKVVFLMNHFSSQVQSRL